MKGERIAVAMSGGVDSSVAAALLLEQGCEVVGLTMQVWPRDQQPDACPGGRACCGLDAVADARRVAQTLGIRHYVINLREAFQRLVIDAFCDEYARGRTPNPCILCNTHVKYGNLLHRAREIGAEKLATGHYARVGLDETTGRWVTWRGVDRAKDQSYTLYDLRQEQLARALFPLGDITKKETRAKAAELGLPVSEKPDSQQICFVLDRSYGEYLSRSRPGIARPGAIVDGAERQVGRHQGIAFYTIGQRHGLRVAHKTPLYVTAIDPERNLVIVGEEEALLAQGLVMRHINYVSWPDLPQQGAKLQVKIRYGAPLVGCTAWKEGDGVVVQFARPQRAVAPGQAAVCYDSEAVALGGIIDGRR
jgi:tRNA-specific 2-thiouridylase